MFENFTKTVKTFLKDFGRLASEQNKLFMAYVKNAHPGNPALYLSRAKLIEECLLLGVSAEFLLKAILLKNSYVLNIDIAQKEKKFDAKFFQRIMDFNSKTPYDKDKLEAIWSQAEKNMGNVSRKTIDFRKCILIFMKEIICEDYFSGIPCGKYEVANAETQEIYGKSIDTSDALWKIKVLRDNYAHIPNPMYEERGLLPFLYNFVVFVAKKEFPDEFSSLEFL